jgi:hypothetical protein
MRDTIITHLPWLLSAITIATMWKAGDRWRATWLLGLANQALWLVWIIAVSAWGLLPMNIVLWIVYARNHLKWSAADEARPAH